MDVTEAIAVLILLIAILVLIYYYLLNGSDALDKLKSRVPSTDVHMGQVLNGSGSDDMETKNKDESVTNKIKVKLSDIDMSALSTDSFSKKLDTFLDAKSDELIKNWSLATTDDIENLESKFSETTNNVDALEKDYQEFKKSSEEFQEVTEKKLDDLDKRIQSLEDN